MIMGVGNDMVDIRRIEQTLERFGERFTNRIFTDLERNKAARRPNAAPTLAKRFAAKEACAKAFGKGIAEGLSFQDMQVTHDQWGKPEWIFSGTAAQWFDELNLTAAFLSISDETRYAVATVVLER